MTDPIATAKQVLADKKVGDIPALSLGAIADSEGVKYKQKTYPDKWDGMLVFNGGQRSILVNTRIDNPARHNFTFAHELGHYFLDHPPSFSRDGQPSIKCNISETGTKKEGREAEANHFAVELLMPQDRFLLLMLGTKIDFALIAGLAIEFMVSKQACSYRLMELTQKPCIVVFSKHEKVTSYKASRAAKGFWGGYPSLPSETVAHEMLANKRQQRYFAECDSRKWLLRTVKVVVYPDKIFIRFNFAPHKCGLLKCRSCNHKRNHEKTETDDSASGLHRKPEKKSIKNSGSEYFTSRNGKFGQKRCHSCFTLYKECALILTIKKQDYCFISFSILHLDI